MNCNNNCWWIILLVLFLCCGCGNGFGTSLANNGGCGCGCNGDNNCCSLLLSIFGGHTRHYWDFFSRIVAAFFSATPSANSPCSLFRETVTWTPVARSFTEHISSWSSSSPPER